MPEGASQPAASPAVKKVKKTDIDYLSPFRYGSLTYVLFLYEPTHNTLSPLLSSPLLSSPPLRLQTRSELQTMRSVTIKQILTASKASDDEFAIDGVSVYHLKIIGCIVDVKEQSTNNVYTIEDGTGRIDIKLWIDENDESAAEKKLKWVQGRYVQVVGKLKDFNGVKSCMAHNMKEVTDFNVLTHHSVEAIYQHLHFTKGPVGSIGSGGAAANIAVWGSKGTGSAVSGHMQGGGTIMDAITQLYNVHGHCANDGAGLSVAFMTSELRGRFGPQQIKDQLEMMASEGHLYTTVDNDHYASSMG
jgi:replication factor A2